MRSKKGGLENEEQWPVEGRVGISDSRRLVRNQREYEEVKEQAGNWRCH